MRRFVPLVLLLLAPLLAACPPPSYVTLFNNSGLPISVPIAGDSTIAPNGHGRFDEREVMASDALRLSSGGCEYLYDFSAGLGDYPFDPYSRRGIQVQVEKDFSVNLLPQSYAGETPASSETALRRDGFPLKPISRKCQP